MSPQQRQLRRVWATAATPLADSFPRRHSRATRYDYGALFALLPDPKRTFGRTLQQVHSGPGCHVTLGFLPTGLPWGRSNAARTALLPKRALPPGCPSPPGALCVPRLRVQHRLLLCHEPRRPSALPALHNLPDCLTAALDDSGIDTKGDGVLDMHADFVSTLFFNLRHDECVPARHPAPRRHSPRVVQGDAPAVRLCLCATVVVADRYAQWEADGMDRWRDRCAALMPKAACVDRWVHWVHALCTIARPFGDPSNRLRSFRQSLPSPLVLPNFPTAV